MGDLSTQEIAKRLFHFHCGVTTPENGNLFQEIGRLAGSRQHCFESGTSFNGWTVPNEWEVSKAEVRKEGKLLFDGTTHPLAVAAFSKTFNGVLNFDELRENVHSRQDVPDAFGYHCMWQYRPWDANWCLCVPHNQFKEWGEGEYEVNLVTRSKPGHMLVADSVVPGRSEETIVLNAHTCHPMQANDDIVGMAVGIKLLHWLKGRDNRWTYRLVLGPEHLGTVFFLRDLPFAEREKLAGCYFLEMPGTNYPLKIASTFRGGTVFDRAMKKAAMELGVDHVNVGWRKGAGNDETVWEAPGYEIPCVEVSRCNDQFAPYREYHTSEDTLENVNWDAVDEFYRVVQRTIEILERNATMTRKFEGLICLSHPDYNLYMERPDPSVSKDLGVDSEKWGHLLDCLLRYFDGKWSILDIAEKHDLPVLELAAYIDRFEAKGLVEKIPTLGPFERRSTRP